MPLHRSIRRQPVAPVPYLRCNRRSAAGKIDLHRIHRCPIGHHRSMHRVITQRACFWVKNFSTSPVTPVTYIWTTGAFTLALITCYAKGVEGNPSASVTPVPHRRQHRCNIVRLSQCQDVNGYYLGSVWPDAPVILRRSIRCIRLSGQFLSNG